MTLPAALSPWENMTIMVVIVPGPTSIGKVMG